MRSTKKLYQRNFKSVFAIFLLVLLPVLNVYYVNRAEGKPVETLASLKQDVRADFDFVRSIDTQVVSKHWEISDRNKITEQVVMLKDLGVNYVAISPPYDHPEKIKMWADEIHKAGLSVWFRSHWLRWEGEEGHLSDMTTEEYLLKTDQFIRSNPEIFKEGDSFTGCVEPEQVFIARNIAVNDWRLYNKFIIDQVNIANAAFAEIGLLGKVQANWISVNGWIVKHALFKTTVEQLGLITVDHYLPPSEELGPDEYALRLRTDLEDFYNQWNKPIILGEWGYHIEKEISDVEQAEYIDKVLTKISDLKYLAGVNYWSHAGNTSRIINDEQGKTFKYRAGAVELKEFFNAKKPGFDEGPESGL